VLVCCTYTSNYFNFHSLTLFFARICAVIYCYRGLVDFTIAGQFVSVVTAIIGVALFALPVGSIFESFQGVLAEANSNRQ
jgi:hypothetical protein